MTRERSEPTVHERDPGSTAHSSSRMPLLAVMCSLIFFCPLTTVIGVVLGLWALAKADRTPGNKGRKLAIVAVALGGMFTVLQVTTTYQVLANLRMVGTMPASAIRDAQQGDSARFRAMFGPSGKQASDDSINEFVLAIQSRFGSIEGSRLPLRTLWAERPEGDAVVYTWELHFTDQVVHARARLRRSDQVGPMIILQELRIPLPEGDDLVFPPEETAGHGY